VLIPRGARVGMEFSYDNSSGNARNPFNPPRRVQTGERSVDEMGNVTLQLAAEPAAAEVLRESKYRRLLGPADARGEFNLGNTMLRQGRLDEAITRYRRALELDPKLVVAHVNLATALSARGAPAEAVVACQRALALQPRDAAALTTLGQAYQALGQTTLATMQFRKALEVDPTYAPARAALTP
jgi:tetratricopeptide (TPR) repeat protein